MTKEATSFQLIAGHPVLDFVNTLDFRFAKSGSRELLTSEAELLRFLKQAQLLTASEVQLLSRSPEPTGVALKLAKAFRESLAIIFYRAVDGIDPAPRLGKAKGSQSARAEFAPPTGNLDWTNKVIKAAFDRRTLVWKSSQARQELMWTWPQLDSTAAVLKLAIAAADLLSSQQLSSVKACGDPDCRWLFLDTSKNGMRRWCDMQICGNRMKMRRLRARAGTTVESLAGEDGQRTPR